MTQAHPVLLLADAGSPTLITALCRGTTVVAQRLGDAQVAHGTALLELLDAVQKEAGVTLQDVDVLGLALGPGSFTGLRTALATFKGLALASQKPLVGVSTLHALALSAAQRGTVGVALDARKGQVYAAVYDVEKGAAVVEPAVMTPVDWENHVQHLGALVYAGDGARLLSRNVTEVRWPHAYPQARALAELVLAARSTPQALETMEPLYVRQSYAELSLGQKKKEGA